MEKEEQLFRKRIQELAENAYSRDIPLHTDFLTLAEQTVFQNMSATLPPVKFVLSGGFPMSERKVLCFLASYEKELYTPMGSTSLMSEYFWNILGKTQEENHTRFIGSVNPTWDIIPGLKM